MVKSLGLVLGLATMHKNNTEVYKSNRNSLLCNT